ncbi:MAG: cell division protein ZapA [Leptospirillia bacterium]
MAQDSQDPNRDGSATRVHIFGHTLTIKGASNADYMQSLAAFVSDHMERLSKASPLTPQPQVAMLAALNIAHELFELRARMDAREADLDNRARHLLESLDAEVTKLSDASPPEQHPDDTATEQAEQGASKYNV